jgi:hypothetical protein
MAFVPAQKGRWKQAYEPGEIISHHLGRLTEKPKKGGTLKDQETTAEYSRLDLNLLDQSVRTDLQKEMKGFCKKRYLMIDESTVKDGSDPKDQRVFILPHLLSGTSEGLEPYFIMQSDLAEERVLCYQKEPEEGADDGVFKFEQAYHLVARSEARDFAINKTPPGSSDVQLEYYLPKFRFYFEQSPAEGTVELDGAPDSRYITDVIVGAKLHGHLKRQPQSEEEEAAAGAAKKKKDAMPTLELKWEVKGEGGQELERNDLGDAEGFYNARFEALWEKVAEWAKLTDADPTSWQILFVRTRTLESLQEQLQKGSAPVVAPRLYARLTIPRELSPGVDANALGRWVARTFVEALSCQPGRITCVTADSFTDMCIVNLSLRPSEEGKSEKSTENEAFLDKMRAVLKDASSAVRSHPTYGELCAGAKLTRLGDVGAAALTCRQGNLVVPMSLDDVDEAEPTTAKDLEWRRCDVVSKERMFFVYHSAVSGDRGLLSGTAAVRSLFFSPALQCLTITPSARDASVQCDVSWCTEPRSVTLQDTYQQFQRWLCSACVGRQAFESFLKTSEPPSGLSLSATVTMFVANPGIDADYLNDPEEIEANGEKGPREKGFAAEIKADLENIFRPIVYPVGDGLTQPPIAVPSTGFDKKYATVTNIKALDGGDVVQFDLTLQRDPTKPLLSSPHRMVEDLMALVTDGDSILYNPPDKYFAPPEKYYIPLEVNRPKPVEPVLDAEGVEVEPVPVPQGLRLLQGSTPLNPPMLTELLTVGWNDYVGKPVHVEQDVREHALGNNLLWGAVSWLHALEPPPPEPPAKKKK